MHTTLEPAVAGDTGDYRLIQLDGINTITGATITATVWRTGETPTTLTGAVHNAGDTLTDPTDKPIARINLDTWLETTATPQAIYNVRTICDLGNGETWSWPNGDPDTIEIQSAGT